MSPRFVGTVLLLCMLAGAGTVYVTGKAIVAVGGVVEASDDGVSLNRPHSALAALNATVEPNDQTNAALDKGFVLGAIAATDATLYNLRDGWLPEGCTYYGIPDGATGAQIAQMWSNYARANAAKWHETSTQVLTQAFLIETYMQCGPGPSEGGPLLDPRNAPEAIK